jgi:hypothetical protein
MNTPATTQCTALSTSLRTKARLTINNKKRPENSIEPMEVGKIHIP